MIKNILLPFLSILFFVSCQKQSQTYNAKLVVRCALEEGTTNGIKHFVSNTIPPSTHVLKATFEPITGQVIAYEDGKPKYESHYENGIQVGITRSWHSNGQLKSETQQMKATEWYKNGQKKVEGIFGYGKYGSQIKLISQKFWNENGTEKRKLWSDLDLDQLDYSGTLYQLYPNGSMKAEATYKEGRATLGKAWYENGQLKMETDYPYKNDFFDYGGEIYNWYENGRPLYYQEISGGGSMILYYDENGEEFHSGNIKSNASFYKGNEKTDLHKQISKFGENPIADLIAQKRELLGHTNFLSKHKNTVWVNGEDTLSFNHETNQTTNKIDQYVFKGTTYSTECYKGLECTMCGYAWLDLSHKDTLVLLKEYRDDFAGIESQTNTFYLKDQKLVQIIDYAYELQAPASTLIWIPENSSTEQIEKVKTENKKALKQHKAQKDSIRKKYESSIVL